MINLLRSISEYGPTDLGMQTPGKAVTTFLTFSNFYLERRYCFESWRWKLTRLVGKKEKEKRRMTLFNCVSQIVHVSNVHWFLFSTAAAVCYTEWSLTFSCWLLRWDGSPSQWLWYRNKRSYGVWTFSTRAPVWYIWEYPIWFALIYNNGWREAQSVSMLVAIETSNEITRRTTWRRTEAHAPLLVLALKRLGGNLLLFLLTAASLSVGSCLPGRLRSYPD